jgi:hypothetical protein
VSNVLHDSPTEFLSDVVSKTDECAAQSVIPVGDGSYECGCSCKGWTATATSVEDGLRQAREHTTATEAARRR